MVAIGEHRAATTEDTVHGSRKTCSDGFHPRCKVLAARRLDDQVDVVGLDRIVSDPEARSLARSPQAALVRSDESNGSERRKPGLRLQRDVTGEAGSERRPRTVRVTRVQARRTTGSVAAPTPASRIAEIERQLSRFLRHRRED